MADKRETTSDKTAADILIGLMNWFMFLSRPKKGANFRWANTVRDSLSLLGEFADGQFTKIYGRITTKYKYHKQQRFENAIRQFDVNEELATEMRHVGNSAFYKTVCCLSDSSVQEKCDVDLTKLSEISSITGSADYLFREVLERKGEEAATAARSSYVRGFSRVVRAADFNDWENLRNELRSGKHLAAGEEGHADDLVTLVALSYKGKEVKITRRMRLLEEDGTPVEDEGILAQTKIQLTDDFLDDFRWSQVVRSCMAIAKKECIEHVRLWIDRLVMMELPKEERSRIYGLVDWEEFGLFSYAVSAVVRVYDAQEPYFGSDFWRKLETVMGVAGKGLIVDDYMLRKYDYTIFFGPSLYERLENGLSRIGGGGVYIRSVTLALATAVLTDGVTVSASNEDLRTKSSVGAWKAWALRTIAEGAYSMGNPSMLRKEDTFRVAFRQFMIIAFWESMVSRCSSLTGSSYLDMSFQRSMTWRKSSCWDGVLEWIGMVSSSCEIDERSAITKFLTQQTEMSVWTNTTGHVASILRLRSSDMQDQRTIVVDLSRFSTAKRGHVTAVAEGTGLWREKVLPCYLRHVPHPDNDQTAIITEERVKYKYQPMSIEYSWMPIARVFLLFLLVLTVVLIVVYVNSVYIRAVTLLLFFASLLYIGCVWVFFELMKWPWVDLCDVGEAVFDNPLLHALYDAGIKKQYRRLRAVPYNEIGWTGISEDEFGKCTRAGQPLGLELNLRRHMPRVLKWP